MPLTAEIPELLSQVVREHLQEIKIIEFQHVGQTIEIRVSHLPRENKMYPRLRFEVHANGKFEGYITGEFFISKEKERTFYANYTENKKVKPEWKRFELAKILEGHIPGVMGEAIAQFVSNDIIQKWHSSGRLSKGGSIMYSRLLEDPRLQGKKLRNGVTYGAFVLEKRESS